MSSTWGGNDDSKQGDCGTIAASGQSWRVRKPVVGLPWEAIFPPRIFAVALPGRVPSRVANRFRELWLLRGLAQQDSVHPAMAFGAQPGLLAAFGRFVCCFIFSWERRSTGLPP
jgi:hypothetical protein